MPTLTITVNQKRYGFVKELLQNLKGVKVNDTPAEADDYVPQTKEQILAGLKESVEELKLIKAGKIKAENWDEFYQSLQS